ncbi:hypothetical protein CLV59_104203 [Chitinophaga dinghuensis]|uniref:Uncharacterized protein n=1 Tax=Chitinophaga dinghuensis TaxID=1539050 RepID=A0A327W7H2_9BACT|nr:hypothetical protein [Chitinophaga dinghuensis]RAJ81978.1 hypothetical protein CLV59_104203 [Chitinophaga dinghuensis]
MKTAKFLLVGAGLVSLVAGALASTAKHTNVLYINDAQRNCKLTVFSVTTSVVGAPITTTFASTQPIDASCPDQLTFYKSL